MKVQNYIIFILKSTKIIIQAIVTLKEPSSTLPLFCFMLNFVFQLLRFPADAA